MTDHKIFDLVLHTIGHGSLPLSDFIDLLERHKIEVLIDVRSNPYSYYKHFSRECLTHELRERSIAYNWNGDVLGGRKESLENSAGVRMDELFDDDPEYRLGVVNLMRTALTKSTAMMCSEEDPRSCHRHKIISNTILQRILPECKKLRDISIIHIRHSGSTEDASQVKVPVQGGLRL